MGRSLVPREAACVVVAAGMDGALPTVIAGQIAAPVVALPTSHGPAQESSGLEGLPRHGQVARAGARHDHESSGVVIVACAGTSDLPMAREALETARFLGRPVRLIADIGGGDLPRDHGGQRAVHAGCDDHAGCLPQLGQRLEQR
jgi:NCAIR mutase (PurE)-related protein